MSTEPTATTLAFPRLMRLLSTPFQRAGFVIGILGIAPWVPMRLFREVSFSDGVRDYLSNVFGLPVRLWLGTAWLGSWYDWLFIPSLCLVAVAFLWPWTGAVVWRWIQEGSHAKSPTPVPPTPLPFHVYVSDRLASDTDQWTRSGDYATLEEAIAAAQSIIDEQLIADFRKNPNDRPLELLDGLLDFGFIPYVTGSDAGTYFNARGYAEKKCYGLKGMAPPTNLVWGGPNL